ncbi:hypothetical protein BU23DRAFT_321637 [Bimuria novae-zelandiae CBS 107.79]|uniref:Uncharacterized protein n=1 Tax=Bimuria novae-zelandiae CBS 107.79 TaxID=1447943 RepID=A0A6A5VIU1_9PLEO|nr:hypothetical protein BU23DRAFT_321637 [Bimuria novae-zelandiae CBS 107.79]
MNDRKRGIGWLGHCSVPRSPGLFVKQHASFQFSSVFVFVCLHTTGDSISPVYTFTQVGHEPTFIPTYLGRYVTPMFTGTGTASVLWPYFPFNLNHTS